MIRSKLNELLEIKGKTKYRLAKEIDVSQNALGKFANNETEKISYYLLDRICKNLNCKLEDIIEFVDDSNTDDENKLK
jgi:putative transcriptional regulator